MYLLPAMIFVGLAGAFFVRLADDTPNSDIPSALIGKTAPIRSLPPVYNGQAEVLSEASIRNDEDDVYVLNVWASWCGPCRQEHAQIEEIAEIEGVKLLGMNQKDRPEKAKAFLDQLGDPYEALGADLDGQASMAFGVYGLPETFLIDSKGIIRKKYIGAITADRLKSIVLPDIEKIRKGS